MNSYHQDILTFLKEQTHAAGEIMRRHYGKDYQIYSKPDNSKVTDVDLAISEMVRERTHKEFPEIGLHSEESPDKHIEKGKSYFIIDELDGTSFFISKIPGFSHQAAFFDAETRQLEVGMVYYPLDDILLYAVRGHGAFQEHNGRSQRLAAPLTRPFDQLHFAHPLRYRGDKYWNLFRDLKVEEGQVVMITALRTLQFTTGELDVAIFLVPRIAPWDWAGEKVIVEELGFSHSFLDGRPIRFGETPPPGNSGYLIGPPAYREELSRLALTHLTKLTN